MLAEALRSVSAQSHLEMELILVRDGGEPLSDEVRLLLGSLEFPALVLERDDPPEGLARARNRGLDKARADAIAFLDDDDLWEPGHVKQLGDALDRDPETSVVYSDSKIWDVMTDATRVLAVDFDPVRFGRNGFIPPSSFAARRPAFERFGQFDPEMRYSEDWDWLLRVARGGGKLARVRGVSATVRIHAGGMSQLEPERLAERRHFLDVLSRRYGLSPIEPKTFWEVAEDLCPGGNASKR
jgi:GT2 family glycosyltransferase